MSSGRAVDATGALPGVSSVRTAIVALGRCKPRAKWRGSAYVSGGVLGLQPGGVSLGRTAAVRALPTLLQIMAYERVWRQGPAAWATRAGWLRRAGLTALCVATDQSGSCRQGPGNSGASPMPTRATGTRASAVRRGGRAGNQAAVAQKWEGLGGLSP